MKKILFLLLIIVFVTSYSSNKSKVVTKSQETKTPFVWEGANVYFLLTARFKNRNPNNDKIILRDKPTGVLRGFEDGNIRGVIQKIDDGYFTDLGINAIWMTPIVDQIHGSVDEGSGNTYGFHGYWTKDWTTLDTSFGTREDLSEVVQKAHTKGIRIMLDAVINHTGQTTNLDPKYPENWVHSSPTCKYNSYNTNINCTLVHGLFDVKAESTEST